MIAALRRFAQYGLVAAGSAVTDWIAFIALTSSGMNHLSAQMASRIAGGVFSFVTNKTWSFDRDISRRFWIEGRRFILLYVFSYVLSLSFLYLAVDILHTPLYAAKLLADSTCFVVNFLVMQAYVFHDRRGFSGWLLGIVRLGRPKDPPQEPLRSSVDHPRSRG